MADQKVGEICGVGQLQRDLQRRPSLDTDGATLLDDDRMDEIEHVHGPIGLATGWLDVKHSALDGLDGHRFVGDRFAHVRLGDVVGRAVVDEVDRHRVGTLAQCHHRGAVPTIVGSISKTKKMFKIQLT